MRSLLLVGVAGVAGGAVNAIAGGGAFVVLPTLIAIGLDPGLANGTLRVGLVAQNLMALYTFHRRSVRELRRAAPLLPLVCLGALAGAWTATHLSGAVFRQVMGVAFVLWALVLTFRPGRFVHPPEEPSNPGLWMQLATLVVGGYGGLMQAGVGLPLMAILVSGLGHPPVRANAIKLTMVLAYTLLALPVFLWAGQVSWPEGGALAGGMLLGSWAGVRLQLRIGAALVRWVVLAMVAVSGVLLLGLR